MRRLHGSLSTKAENANLQLYFVLQPPREHSISKFLPDSVMQRLLSVIAAALPVLAGAKKWLTAASSLMANMKGFVLLRCLGPELVYGFS